MDDCGDRDMFGRSGGVVNYELGGEVEPESRCASPARRDKLQTSLCSAGSLGFGDGKLFYFACSFCNALRASRPRRCRWLTEAVGVMSALKVGVALSSVRRPLGGTVVVSECVGGEGSRVKTLESLRDASL